MHLRLLFENLLRVKANQENLQMKLHTCWFNVCWSTTGPGRRCRSCCAQLCSTDVQIGSAGKSYQKLSQKSGVWSALGNIKRRERFWEQALLTDEVKIELFAHDHKECLWKKTINNSKLKILSPLGVANRYSVDVLGKRYILDNAQRHHQTSCSLSSFSWCFNSPAFSPESKQRFKSFKSSS